MMVAFQYWYKATMLNIVDGDTVDCSIDLGFSVTIQTRIRLAGINAPELSTEKGVMARTALLELAPVGTEMIIHTVKDRKEKYGRYLAYLYTKEMVSLNSTMISLGHAKPAT